MTISIEYMSEMRAIVSSLIVFVYALSLGFGIATPFVPSIKIQVEHRHVVVQGHHHHHDSMSDDGHNEHSDRAHKHDSHGEHTGSVPHSHEVSVPMINAYVANVDTAIPVEAIVSPEAVVFAFYNDTAPEDISLRSIFRPPICA